MTDRERGSSRLEPGDLLTVPQARAILPVSRATFYRLVARGELRAIRVPSVGGGAGRVLVFRRGIEEYVARQAEAPVPGQRIDTPLPAETADQILSRLEGS